MLRAVVVVWVLGVPVAVWLVLRAGGWLWCSLPVVVLLVLRAILVVRVTCMPLVVQLVLQALEVLRCGGGVWVWPSFSATSSASVPPSVGCRTRNPGVARPKSNVFSFGVHRFGCLHPTTMAPLRSHVPRPKLV